MSLSDYYQAAPFKKPEPRRTQRGRAVRKARETVRAIRAYCFARERSVCRCCRLRTAESLHELTPRSLGGNVSRRNSVALCGDGVRGCHGFCQRHEITVGYGIAGAESTLVFTPETDKAADWLKVKRGEQIVSEPMAVLEAAE